MSSSKTWVRPKVERIGRIGDVANTIPPAVSQNSGGSACTLGSPSCAFS